MNENKALIVKDDADIDGIVTVRLRMAVVDVTEGQLSPEAGCV